MSRNIKEIGKELMGKSLNSFHRKTGLPQLEENNKMQDGILDGILSQVDDAYIEKTEQSNVIHLDGSGDGVVVLDSIEGNTMVNLIDYSTLPASHINQTWNRTNNGIEVIFNGQRDVVWKDKIQLKANTVYTIMYDLETTMTTDTHITGETSVVGHFVYNKSEKANWYNKYYTSSLLNIREEDVGVKFTNKVNMSFTTREESYLGLGATFFNTGASGVTKFNNLILLEGDWTNKEVNYFDGLQSSFEEKVNDEGKYEIEILSKNKNLIDNSKSYQSSYSSWMPTIGSLNNIVTTDTYNATFDNRGVGFLVKDLKPNTQYTLSIPSLLTNNRLGYALYSDENSINSWQKHIQGQGDITTNKITFTTPNEKTVAVVGVYGSYNVLHNNGALDGTVTIGNYRKLQLEVGNKNTEFNLQKQNKIKLLINEPLRKLPNGIKDKLCIKDGKLMIERNLYQINITSSMLITQWGTSQVNDDSIAVYGESKFPYILTTVEETDTNIICDKLPVIRRGNLHNTTHSAIIRGRHYIGITLPKSILSTGDRQGFNRYVDELNPTVIYQSIPRYEEVVNEYGEPILLEGYENGTIYIDSTIVPTTTVRYTPKMESFKTLKEVNNNNIMLTNDVNDNIIPYMMDVDLMIMEKEMALMSQYKIRRIGAKDMTSMQKRTQDMLTRLIKGKTLTEQECKTRVVTYLDAGKITDAQADELMLLISEVYA